MPPLAQLVAASPLEAAIHDAYGKALGRTPTTCWEPIASSARSGAYLTAEFAGEYLDRYTLREPKPRMPLYHLVGALDPLTAADVATPIDDGLPETLPEWIAADGLTHLKIKLTGDDLAWDVDRVVSVEARGRAGAASPRLHAPGTTRSISTRNAPSVEYVLDFLAQVEARSPRGVSTACSTSSSRRTATCGPIPRTACTRRGQIKPVVIDESLVDLESLLLSRELGYSGVALKACKGHSEALLMGAAAQKYGMFLCVQDLTCPGRRFCTRPAWRRASPPWRPSKATPGSTARRAIAAGPSAFRRCSSVTDGTLGTAALDGPGLGY